MNILEMNHIKKKFDEKTVLKDISLSVKEGEGGSIIGPSGSGKSTLLRSALSRKGQMTEIYPTAGRKW